MPFTYSCFISYRQVSPYFPTQQQYADRFIAELTEALSREVGSAIRDKPLYVDRESLQNGTTPDKTLPTALCESMAMILVYTPMYFDKAFPYYARIYKAMEQLEKQRLALLPNRQDTTQGLILPLILRGEDSLPSELKTRRPSYRFTGLTPGNHQLQTHPRYAAQVQQIAAHITALCQAFAQLRNDICKDCKNFKFPPDRGIRQWLKGIPTAPARFPGLEG